MSCLSKTAFRYLRMGLHMVTLLYSRHCSRIARTQWCATHKAKTQRCIVKLNCVSDCHFTLRHTEPNTGILTFVLIT